MLIYPIVNEVTGCLLTEVDRKLLNTIERIGIKNKGASICPSIRYIASETIPVYSSSEVMIGFYNRNKYLHNTSNFNIQKDDTIHLT